MSKAWVTLAVATLFASGCGGQDGRVKHAGQAVGETLTDFAHGVGSGVDKALKVDVELSKELAALGLGKTVAKTTTLDDHKRVLTVYMKSPRSVTASLVAKAIDADGEEIGRSTVNVEFADDDAKYVAFPFQPEMDYQLVRRYVIDVRPGPSEHSDVPKPASPEAEREE